MFVFPKEIFGDPRTNPGVKAWFEDFLFLPGGEVRSPSDAWGADLGGSPGLARDEEGGAGSLACSGVASVPNVNWAE